MKFDWLNFIRAFVRPYTAYLFVAVLSVIVIWGFIKFADLELYKMVLIAFVEMVGIIVGFYYGSRNKPNSGG